MNKHMKQTAENKNENKNVKVKTKKTKGIYIFRRIIVVLVLIVIFLGVLFAKRVYDLDGNWLAAILGHNKKTLESLGTLKFLLLGESTRYV